MSKRDRRITVRLTQEEYKKLELWSMINGETISEVVRGCLKEYEYYTSVIDDLLER